MNRLPFLIISCDDQRTKRVSEGNNVVDFGG
jgi:hypothetical protein